MQLTLQQVCAYRTLLALGHAAREGSRAALCAWWDLWEEVGLYDHHRAGWPLGHHGWEAYWSRWAVDHTEEKFRGYRLCATQS